MNVLTYENFMDNLLKEVPEVKPIYDDEVGFYEEVLPYGILARVTDYAIDQYEGYLNHKNDLTCLLKLVNFLEYARKSEDDNLQTLIQLGFLENIEQDYIHYEGFKSLLGPRLKKGLTYFEDVFFGETNCGDGKEEQFDLDVNDTSTEYEKFDANGEHIGVFEIGTIKRIKPADPQKNIKKEINKRCYLSKNKSASKHCCEKMGASLETNYNKTGIFYIPRTRDYIIDLSDNSASYSIDYCPWCGKKLPKTLGDEWFDELEKLGFDDPRRQEIPSEFKDDRWWRSGKYHIHPVDIQLSMSEFSFLHNQYYLPEKYSALLDKSIDKNFKLTIDEAEINEIRKIFIKDYELFKLESNPAHIQAQAEILAVLIPKFTLKPEERYYDHYE